MASSEQRAAEAEYEINAESERLEHAINDLVESLAAASRKAQDRINPRAWQQLLTYVPKELSARRFYSGNAWEKLCAEMNEHRTRHS